MSKILESLPLTVVAGIVLTVVMVFATNYLEHIEDKECTEDMSEEECIALKDILEGPEKAISDLQKKIN